MRYINYLLLVISFLSLHAMQKQIDITDIEEVGEFVDKSGYWLKLHTNELISAYKEGQIICTKAYEASGIWVSQKQQFPEWWYNLLANLHKRKQVEQNIESITEKFRSL